MQLAVAIDLAAVFPRLPEQPGLPGVFLRPSAQRVLQLGVEAAGLDAKTPTHRTYREQRATLGNERVSHFASLAKYAVAFWDVALLGHLRQLALQLPDPGILRPIFGPLCELSLPCIQRMLAHAEPLGNIRHPVAPLGNLRHGIALELVAEICLPHRRLLSANSGKKASTSLGAIHLQRPHHCTATLVQGLSTP